MIDGLIVHRGSLVYDTPDVFAKFGHYRFASTCDCGQEIVSQIRALSRQAPILRMGFENNASSSLVFVMSNARQSRYELAFAERLVCVGDESSGELIIHVTPRGLEILVRFLCKALKRWDGHFDQSERLHPYETSFVAPGSVCLTVYGGFRTRQDLRVFAQDLGEVPIDGWSATASNAPLQGIDYQRIAKEYAKLG